MAKAEHHLPVFLKCIEIQGFKSFADRLKLELGQGMSVIVGPNGSGKSNVADAVRWVLGEQSAKSLRGSKMEDVIFAGSTKRRPVGMAEVSLIFDNSTGIFPLDFQEVTITRRVYRDGEGQYFINKAHCRLKDIQELFMDTGAGKEGFSIIGQGRVEEILTLKSEERRNLIEEAAGITKFRARKREAAKRLEDTDQNLARLTDILSEIESQIDPLAEQAKTAEKSLYLSEEQQRLEIELVVGDLTEVKAKLDSVAQNLESLKGTLALSGARLAEGEGKNIEDKLSLQKLEEKLQEQQSVVYRLEQEQQDKKHQINLRQERRQHLEEQWTSQASEYEDLLIKEGEGKSRIAALETKTALLSKTLAAAQAEVENRETALSQTRAEAGGTALEDLKSRLFSAMSEQAGCTNDLTGITHSLTALEHQKRDIQGQREQTQSEYESTTDQLQHLLDEEHQLGIEEETWATRHGNLEAELTRLDSETQSATLCLGELTRKTDRLRARIQVLQAMEDSLEGYQRGVREVVQGCKKGKKECAGVKGTVADLLTVDQQYELALETALGGSLQNVMTETAEEAKSCIAYLKKNQFGRATFLPLDQIQGSRLDLAGNVIRDPAYKGLAVDLVQYAEQFAPAMEFLLGRIIIAADMEGANRIARLTGFRTRIVTLEGDQVHPGGSLSGGSVQRRGENLLGRSRELEELNKALVQTKAETDEKEQLLQTLTKHKEKVQEEFQEIQEKKGEFAQQRTRLKVTLENLGSQSKRLERELSTLRFREAELAKELEETEKRFKEARGLLQAAEDQVRQIRQALDEQEQKVKESAGVAERMTEDLTQAKVHAAKLEQELAQAREGLEKEQADGKDNGRLIKQRQEIMEKLKAALAELDQEEEKLSGQLEAQEAEQLRQQQSMSALRQEREDLLAVINQTEAELQTLRNQVESAKERIHQEEVNSARWETEWESGQKRLWEEFSLTWESAPAYQGGQSRSALMRSWQDVKRQIEELGPVNQAAIEEYPKLLNRFEFLSGQHSDLIDARQKLELLIADLDHTMSERFKTGFAAVNQAFQQVFVELFNGGHAELRLDDPENLLDTGVEIIAQPPGKKPQYLSLLSGGERALTAIALLFALLKVKPSPFCILDEIEASLDDANVRRFADYVKSLADSTQFLVISHRKGTMEAADTLHGIAMEESGVSKLLTVQLDERESASA